MIKAVVKYSEFQGYERFIKYQLSLNDVTVLKVKEKHDNIDGKITILIESREKLNELISLLDYWTTNGVTLIKARKAIKVFNKYI